MKPTLAALLVLLGMICAAQAFGPGLGNRFGKEGALNHKKSGGGGSCSPTGLIFNVACNSMYATVIHF